MTPVTKDNTMNKVNAVRTRNWLWRIENTILLLQMPFHASVFTISDGHDALLTGNA